MGRTRKPKKVDTLKHAGYEISIFFDANPKALNFLAEFGGTWHSSPQAGELKEKLKQLIQQTQDLNWVPVITIAYSLTLRGLHTENILDIKRSLYALRHDGALVSCEWERLPNERIEASRREGAHVAQAMIKDRVLVLPAQAQWQTTKIKYLPFSKDLWVALNHLSTIVGIVGDRAARLLDAPDELPNVDLVKHILHQRVDDDTATN